ncbi:MAG: hypothetical protein ACFCUS_11970 [Rubrimonas sp.]
MWEWQAWIGPAIIAAVISAFVTAFGWFVPYWREQRKEEARKAQRAADMRRALSAEIASHLSRYEEVDLHGHFDVMAKAIDADPSYTPFVPRDALNARVYHAMLADLTLLPEDAIDPVVSYYAQLDCVRCFAEDLRSPEYASVSVERRKLMYEHFIGMKIHAAALARTALARLDCPGVSIPVAGSDAEERASATSASRT